MKNILIVFIALGVFAGACLAEDNNRGNFTDVQHLDLLATPTQVFPDGDVLVVVRAMTADKQPAEGIPVTVWKDGVLVRWEGKGGFGKTDDKGIAQAYMKLGPNDKSGASFVLVATAPKFPKSNAVKIWVVSARWEENELYKGFDILGDSYNVVSDLPRVFVAMPEVNKPAVPSKAVKLVLTFQPAAPDKKDNVNIVSPTCAKVDPEIVSQPVTVTPITPKAAGLGNAAAVKMALIWQN